MPGIGLARAGSKKRPYYHVVILLTSVAARLASPDRSVRGTRCDQAAARGHADRIKHWMSHGAQPTDRVARFLDEVGSSSPARSNPTKALPA